MLLSASSVSFLNIRSTTQVLGHDPTAVSAAVLLQLDGRPPVHLCKHLECQGKKGLSLYTPNPILENVQDKECLQSVSFIRISM